MNDRSPRRAALQAAVAALLVAALITGCAKATPTTAPGPDPTDAVDASGPSGHPQTGAPDQGGAPTGAGQRTSDDAAAGDPGSPPGDGADPIRPGAGDRAASHQPEPGGQGAQGPGEGVPAIPAAPELPGGLAVMIENSWNARPQAGLEKADIVYEMEAEGGITRFLALYHTWKPDRLGPVRSARMGFYDIAVAYGVPYAHAGGSADVREELRYRNTRLLDLDGIYTCGACFWRISEREMPHNLYTDTNALIARAREVGWALRPLYRFPRGDAPAGGTPVTEIAFDWGERSQDVTWTWNGQRYLRAQSGEPHVAEGGERIGAQNLILLFTRYVWDPNTNDGKGQHHVSITGSGAGYLYRDGKAWPIRWSKPSREEHYAFTTPDGEPVHLAPGQTWVEILKSERHVTAGIPR